MSLHSCLATSEGAELKHSMVSRNTANIFILEDVDEMELLTVSPLLNHNLQSQRVLAGGASVTSNNREAHQEPSLCQTFQIVPNVIGRCHDVCLP